LAKRILITFLVLMFAGCATRPADKTPAGPTPAEPPRISSASVVKITPDAFEIGRGKSGEATLRLKIDAGYHVNANPASEPYLKPTELQLTPTNDLKVSFLVYPTGQTRKFGFSEKPLAVYEGESIIKVRLEAAKSARPGPLNLAAKLNVQACDDQLCYAPGTIDLTIPVTIK
jgi:hypothetical protein